MARLHAEPYSAQPRSATRTTVVIEGVDDLGEAAGTSAF